MDGDHTHDAVIADLRTYFPLLRSDGLLTGDDYGVRGWWDDGVTSAVHAFVREREDVRVEAVHNGQFVLRKIAG